jgi:hypothetical protein
MRLETQGFGGMKAAIMPAGFLLANLCSIRKPSEITLGSVLCRD